MTTTTIIGVGAVNFGGKTFLHKNICMKKCPNFTWYLPKKYFSGILNPLPPSLMPMTTTRPVRTTLAELRSGHCRLLTSYIARITTGVSDVCPECGVAPHSVEHLFNCSAHPTQLTVQDLWDNPVEVADFLNLDSWRQWTRREDLLGYHNNNDDWCW